MNELDEMRARVKLLTCQRDDLLQAIKDMEWSPIPGGGYECPACGAGELRGHLPWCRLQAAIIRTVGRPAHE